MGWRGKKAWSARAVVAVGVTTVVVSVASYAGAISTDIGSRATQVAGQDRFETAVAISQAAGWGEGDGKVPASTVYLANGNAMADALALGASDFERGPLLFVTKDSLPAVTAAELARLKPCEVVGLGGSAVVSQAVLRAADAYTVDCESEYESGFTLRGDAVLNGCYSPNGKLRIVASAQDCGDKEIPATWSKAGPEGPAGPAGPAGATGPTGATGPQGPAGDAAECDVVQTGLLMQIGEEPLDDPDREYYELERFEIEVTNEGTQPAFLQRFEWAPVSDDGAVHDIHGLNAVIPGVVGYEYPETLQPGESRWIAFSGGFMGGPLSTEIARPGETITQFIPAEADFFCDTRET